MSRRTLDLRSEEAVIADFDLLVRNGYRRVDQFEFPAPQRGDELRGRP